MRLFTHAESGQLTYTPLSLDTAKHSRYILSTILYTQKKNRGGGCESWVIYTGTVTETPLFTVHLYHSETSGVAEGGKRQILAVMLRDVMSCCAILCNVMKCYVM